jgi:hypothetical protein
LTTPSTRSEEWPHRCSSSWASCGLCRNKVPTARAFSTCGSFGRVSTALMIVSGHTPPHLVIRLQRRRRFPRSRSPLALLATRNWTHPRAKRRVSSHCGGPYQHPASRLERPATFELLARRDTAALDSWMLAQSGSNRRTHPSSQTDLVCLLRRNARDR